jgi:hypothetical protein
MTGVLSRRSAKALVDAKLASLGHDTSFLTPAALDTLRARAGHEAAAFGAALGAVLFLAATEDAPRIESRHVEEAVPIAEAPLPPASAGWRAWQIVAAGAVAGALLVFWVTQRPARVAGSAPESAPIVKAAPPAQAMAAPAPPSPIKPAPPAPPKPTPPPEVALPSAPPHRVSLVIPAGDRETSNRFTDIANRLRQAKLGDVRLESINSAKTDTRTMRHHVVYFFSQDKEFAKNVADALDSAEDASHIRRAWVPILVPAAVGAALHPPGSIDVFAP